MNETFRVDDKNSKRHKNENFIAPISQRKKRCDSNRKTVNDIVAENLYFDIDFSISKLFDFLNKYTRNISIAIDISVDHSTRRYVFSYWIIGDTKHFNLIMFDRQLDGSQIDKHTRKKNSQIKIDFGQKITKF